MPEIKAVYKNAWPYQKDKMNLPVADVAVATPFYATIMGFTILSSNDIPIKSIILSRDDIQIGLAENGGDPTQDGCFFEVENVDDAFAELKANGLNKEISGMDIQKHGEVSWKVFFVVAPDGLCYCIGERQES